MPAQQYLTNSRLYMSKTLLLLDKNIHHTEILLVSLCVLQNRFLVITLLDSL